MKTKKYFIETENKKSVSRSIKNKKNIEREKLGRETREGHTKEGKTEEKN